MGAVFSIYLKFRIKQDEEDNVIAAIKGMKPAIRASYVQTKGHEPMTLKDCFDLAFGGPQFKAEYAPSEENTKDWSEVIADFDACYSWYGIMEDYFRAIAPFLRSRSVLYIEPDNDTDAFVVKNGTVIIK